MFEKGSEWNKWDLHIHSPNTHLNNGYGGTNVADFIKKIKERGIKAVGLTNYFNFTFEDFDLKQKLEERGIVTFLNLEIRLAYQNKEDECCDMHIVFDNEVGDRNIVNFLANLDVTVGGNSKKANSLSDQDFDEATVESNDLLRVLGEESSNLSGRHLIGFLSRGKGSSRSSMVYEKIARNSHFLIHSSDRQEKLEEDREFWLSESKPLLQSSDAHNLDQVGEKFTWIKSDLTFEGLKQIVYEPEERLCIRQLKPEDDKIPSRIIDRVEYRRENEQVQVFFNQNLNSVIGVRGSGKSTLLKNIVYYSDNEEFRNRLPEPPKSEEKLFKMQDFKVVWSDGVSCDEGDNGGTRKVLFLPQKYLGSRVYQGEGGSNSEINKFITSLLEENESFNDVQEEIKKVKVEEAKKINSLIEELLLARSNMQSYSEELKKHSGEEDLKKEIEKKNEKLKEVKESVNLEDTDLENYEKLTTERSDIESKISQHKKDIDLYDTLVEKGIFDAGEILEYGFSENERGKITNHIEKRCESSKGFIEERKGKIDEALKNLEEEKDKKDEEIKPIQDKINKNKEVEGVAEGLKKDNEELKKIRSISKDKEEEIKNIKEIEEKIVEVYEKAVQYFIACIKKIKIESANDLAFDFDLGFDQESFNDFLGKLNNRDTKDIERDEDVINEVFEKLLLGKIRINKPHELKDCLIDLFRFRHALDYLSGIKNKEGRTLNDMSDGEKMTALLTLIFRFDKNGYPILIDQPEDDLDSTVISETVSMFIKDQKKERQIIMASHNANLVICSDSEEVLVASKQNNSFNYETGSIENPEINRKIVEVLEGGEEAFRKRRNRYQF